MENWLPLEYKKKFFPVYSELYLKPKGLIKYGKEWRASRRLIRRQTEEPSTLLFTTHKCASTFFSKFLQVADQESEFSHLNYDSFFAGQQVSVEQAFDDKRFLSRGFREQGFIYGPMRSNRDIPNKHAYKILLILRDPRDVMVSLYYSMRYSHALISKSMVSIRQEAEEHSVDSYVYLRCQEFLERYNSYLNLLNQNYNLVYLRYDDLIEAPKRSLRRISNFIGIELRQQTFERLKNQLVPPTREHLIRHRRSGRSGQFKIKLQPATIEYLNHEFKQVLHPLGFAEEGN